MRHLEAAIARADHVLLFDNSGEHDMRAVLAVDDGRVTMRSDMMPRWVSTYLASLIG